MRWIYNEVELGTVTQLSNTLKVSPSLARLLVRLGVTDAEEAQKFLYPRLAHLEDPFKITNVDFAVDRLLRAIAGKESILVLGDYDVDGVTSTTLLVQVLKRFGIAARYVIPIRSDEGYGLSHSIIERSLKEGIPDLFIALDCGTNSTEEVAFLRKQNIDVIIVDHHRSKEAVPEEAILINPHVFDEEESSWSHMCSVGLVFKLAHALIKALREQNDVRAHDIKLKEYLDIVAVGTVADMVALSGENRILTKFGLREIQRNGRAGILALCKVSGIDADHIIRPADVSFKLGPRINASGRLGDATIPVNMLLEDNFDECCRVAEVLDEMNRERQDIERQVTQEAQERIEAQGLAQDLAIVLYAEDWHAGVVGIVAGKITRLYHRPCVVLGKDGAFAKGSGRSIEGVDLIKALNTCDDILESWGGHPMAAGVSLRPEKCDVFRQQFSQAIALQTGGGLPEPSIEITEWLPSEALNDRFLDELDLLHPFGTDNPEPIFGLKQVVIPRPPAIFAEKHFRFQVALEGSPHISGVAWKKADNIPPVNTPIDLAVRFGWSYWNGRKWPQLELVDWKS